MTLMDEAGIDRETQHIIGRYFDHLEYEMRRSCLAMSVEWVDRNGRRPSAFIYGRDAKNLLALPVWSFDDYQLAGDFLKVFARLEDAYKERP